MSNQMFNIMAGAYFDQLSEGWSNFSVGTLDPSILIGSMANPLQTFRLMCMDQGTEMCFEASQLAEVTGVSAEWFESDRLNAPPDEALKALGVLALVYLSSLRNEATKRGFKVDVAENSLEAESTFRAVLEVNRQLLPSHKKNKH